MATPGAAFCKALDETLSQPTPQLSPPDYTTIATPCKHSHAQVRTCDIPELSDGPCGLLRVSSNPFRVHPYGFSFTMTEYNSASWQAKQTTIKPTEVETEKSISPLEAEYGSEVEERGARKKSITTSVSYLGRRLVSIMSFIGRRMTKRRTKVNTIQRTIEQGTMRKLKHDKCEAEIAYIFGHT